MPSVFFVCSGPIVTGEPLLDNVLCLMVARHGVEFVRAAIDPAAPASSGLGQLIARLDRLEYKELQALRDRVRVHLAPAEWAEVKSSGLYLSKENLRSISASTAMEVGSHTQTHVHTRSLDADSVGPELIENARCLEQLTHRAVRSFSFPYGHRADATNLVLSTLKKSGQDALFLVHAIPNFISSPNLWYRVSLSDHPASALRRRIEIMPRFRAIRDLMRSKH
jgi:peptidoglycan/xylan/chitin deacetylase (PgdA/CDA1 family)